MRMTTPRIAPLEKAEWNGEQQELMKRYSPKGEPINIFKTLLRHSKLLKRWTVFANHILGKSSLPERERELIILRIGWLCRAGYEWCQHVEIGLKAGLTKTDIEHIKTGADSSNWSANDMALLQATDELFNDAFISDATWAELKKTYGTEQLMDIVFTVGNYNLVSMALNTFGVQLEETTPDTFHQDSKNS